MTDYASIVLSIRIKFYILDSIPRSNRLSFLEGTPLIYFFIDKCKSTLGVVTYIFFLSSFFLPFGFLLFILTAEPVSFARFLRKRISSTTVKALSFSRSEFIIFSRAQRADHARIASELRFRFGHLSIGLVSVVAWQQAINKS